MFLLHVCGISVYEGNSVTFNQFNCYLNKKWSINVKIDFKISLIMISAVSMFRPNSVGWYIIFVLRQRIIYIDMQSNLWIEKCLCKETAPNVRQRTCCYFFQKSRNQFVTVVKDASEKMVIPILRMIRLWYQKHRDITRIQRHIKKQYRLIFPMRTITFIKHVCPDITHYSHHNY